MKRRFLICAVALLCILTTGCDASWLYPAPIPQRKVVLFYASAHDNGLGSYLAKDVEDVKEGYLPLQSDTNNVMLVYRHLPEETPRLSRFSKDEDGNFHEDILMDYPDGLMMGTYSLLASTFKQVLADAETAYPSTTRSLIISSHGKGFIPANYSESTKAIGPDDNVEMDITDFAEVLEDWHLDILVFDNCYMGGIETAYQVADVCDYVMGSPTETMSAGMVSNEFIEPFFTMEKEKAAKALCEIYMDKVRTESEYSKSGTVGLVKTSELPALSDVCKEIFSKYRSRIYTVDKSLLQRYYRGTDKWFYDFEDYVQQVATDDSGQVDSLLYSNFQQALGTSVIYKDHTDKFLSLKINKCCGLSTYAPYSDLSTLNAFYKTLEWNKDTNLIY